MSLRAEGIRKRFDDRTILAGASLTLAPGEVVLLAGANGSGKTTFARIVATLSAPDDGEITLDDQPVDSGRAEARRAIGFSTHAPLLYESLTPIENLEFFGKLAGVIDAPSRATTLLDRFGMSAFAHAPLHTFSRGMLQRVVLTRALLPRPRYLILDEPYAGLDADGTAALNALLHEAVSGGAGALLVGHDPERAAGLATRSVRLAQGRIEAA
ncbi:MAG: ABC transporter ATP-binding protein [Candidatus Eiseniibacteriota bacterium]